MEFVGMIIDKLIMIIAGLYIAFIWPLSINRKVKEGKLDKSELDKFKWLRPVGIILILISIVVVFSKLAAT